MHAPTSFLLIALLMLPSQTSGQPDFSTPRATVETYIRAMQETDVETLARCYDTSADGRGHEATLQIVRQWPLDGYARAFSGATIDSVEVLARNPQRASATVRLANGSTERLWLSQGPSGWKLVPG